MPVSYIAPVWVVNSDGLCGRVYKSQCCFAGEEDKPKKMSKSHKKRFKFPQAEH